MLRLVPLTVLIATSAVAAPIWVQNGYETGVRGRVTEVDAARAQVVIEDRDRVTIAPTAQVAMADIRAGEQVEARYVQDADGTKSMLSMVPVFKEVQAP
jgi:flavin-dependent dehydrogenase